MKYKKWNMLTAVTLALSMVGTAVLPGGSVFASDGTENSIQITTQTDTSQTEAPAIEIIDGDIVVREQKDTEEENDGIQVSEETQLLDASVTVRDTGIQVTDGDGKEEETLAGDTVTLEVTAENEGGEDRTFRLYFWDCAEELPEDTAQWESLLTQPCMDVEIAGLAGDNSLSIELHTDGKTEDTPAAWKTDTDEASGAVTARCLEMALPAGSSAAFELDVCSRLADQLTVVPAIEADGAAAYFEALPLQWAVKDITITEIPEEPKADDDAIQISGEEGEAQEVQEAQENEEDSLLIEIEPEDTGEAEPEDAEAEPDGMDFEETLPIEVIEQDPFTLELDTTPEEEKEAVAEQQIDPVLETYIRNNADPDYVQIDKVALGTYMVVRNTLVDGRMIPEETSIDEVMAGYPDSLYAQFHSMVALYDVGDENGYFVGYINTMMDDTSIDTRDVIFANYNNEGEGLSNCIYDEDTGLAYIPKENYRAEDGTYTMGVVQAQLLQAMTQIERDFGDETAVSAVSYNAGTEKKPDIQQEQSEDEVLSYEAQYTVEKGLDSDEMVVSVNGIPVSSEMYDYNAKTGELTVYQSSSSIASVYVTADKQSIADEIQDALGWQEVHAAAVRPSEMLSAGRAKWTDGMIESKVGQIYHVTYQAGYFSGAGGGQIHEFHYGYGISNPNGVILDNDLSNLINIVNGSGSNLDWNNTNIAKESTYVNWRIQPNVGSRLPYQWISGEGWIGLKCAHINTGIRLPSNTANIYQDCECILRLLHYDKEGKFAIFGVYTPYAFTQSGVGMFRFEIETSTTRIQVEKQWEDSDNAFLTRPESIAFRLLRSSDGGNTWEQIGEKYTSAQFGWSCSWEELPIQSDDGSVKYTYKVEEIGADDYLKSGGELTGSNEAGWTAQFVNRLPDLEVEKIWNDSGDAQGLRPESIGFKLMRSSDGGTTWEQVAERYTSAEFNWSCRWSGLPVKGKNGETYTYKVEEFGSPSEYTVSGGELTGDEVNGYHAVVTNSLEPGSDETHVEVRKVWDDSNDAEGLRPSSITVTLFRRTNGGSWEAVDTQLLNSSNGWYYRWDNLPSVTEDGTAYQYKLEESGASGYEQSGGQLTSDGQGGYTATFTNRRPPDEGGKDGNLVIIKRSADSSISTTDRYSLYGAMYGVYEDRACTRLVMNLKTDNSGRAEAPIGSLEAGTYYVKEKIPSAGFDLDPTVHTVHVYEGDTTTVTRVISNEPPQSGNLKLIKSSMYPEITDGNGCYSLEGAQYTVYSNSGCTQRVTVLTTDKNGEAEWNDIPLGDYWIKETKAPEGYGLSSKVTHVVIKASHTTTSPYVVEVEDKPGNDPRGIVIDKIQNGEKTETIPTLAGTQFTICYYDGFYTKSNLPSSPTRKWVIEVKEENGMYVTMLEPRYLVDDESDELYIIDGNVVLPYGTISIQETKAAAGYTLNGYLKDASGTILSIDSELFVTQVIGQAGNVHIEVGNEFHGENTPKNSMIKIEKYDGSGDPLEGVTFELADHDGNVVATLTTDSRGIVLFEDLYPDVYWITEIKTAEGHSLLKDKIRVECPTRVTESDIAEYNIDKGQCTYDPADNIYYIFELTYEVTNGANFKLPYTGGTTSLWTFAPLAGGVGIFAGLGVLLFRRKRKR